MRIGENRYSERQSSHSLPQYWQGHFIVPCPRNTFTLLLFCLLTLAAASSHSLNDAEKIIQTNCSKCHGLYGITKVDTWPNLNCQNRGYLYHRLLKFRSHDDHDIDKAVKELSIADIDFISRYYSSKECTQP